MDVCFLAKQWSASIAKLLATAAMVRRMVMALPCSMDRGAQKAVERKDTWNHSSVGCGSWHQDTLVELLECLSLHGGPGLQILKHPVLNISSTGNHLRTKVATTKTGIN